MTTSEVDAATAEAMAPLPARYDPDTEADTGADLATDPPPSDDSAQVAFSYESLPLPTVTKLQGVADRIRIHGMRAAESVVAIGNELAAAKAELAHGAFLPWLAYEFPDYSERQARRCMEVYAWTKSAKLADLGPIDVSALYLLAAPSTPDSVRHAAIIKAKSGERVTHADVKLTVDEAKQPEAASQQPVASSASTTASSPSPAQPHTPPPAEQAQATTPDTTGQLQKGGKQLIAHFSSPATSPDPVNDDNRDDGVAAADSAGDDADVDITVPEGETVERPIKVPDGSTMSRLARDMMAGEDAGMPRAEVARQHGIGAGRYRKMRDVVFCADYPDLWPADRDRADAAVRHMDATLQVAHAHEQIQPLLERLCGNVHGFNRHKAAADRYDKFAFSISTLSGIINAFRNDPIPYLNQEQIDHATKQLATAADDLNAFKRRIGREGKIGELEVVRNI